MTDLRAYVAQDSVGAAGENTWSALKASKMGHLIVQDFFTQMAIEGRAYQIRAGTVATGLAADAVLTDTAANMCVDAASGTTIIPVGIRIAFRDVATEIGRASCRER